jgi:DNA end-binding protein Ku
VIWVSVKELVDAKINHLPIPKGEAPRATSGEVENLLDALRKSLGEKSAGVPKKPVASERSPAWKGIGLVKTPTKSGSKQKSA